MSGEAELAVFKVDKIKSEIIVGILVAVIIPFLQSLFTVIQSSFLWIFSMGHKGFLDFIYQTAALGLNESYSYNLQNCYYTVIIMACALGLLEIPRDFMEKKKDSQLNTKEEIQTEITKLKKSIKISKKMLVIALVLGLLDGLLGFISGASEHSLISSYQHRLTILAPQISEQEEEEIKAQWATMKNKKDHRAVVARMDQLAIEHKVTLPKSTILWD